MSPADPPDPHAFDPLPSPEPPEPTLRDVALDALLAAGFVPLRRWDRSRPSCLSHVRVVDRAEDGVAFLSVAWEGNAKLPAASRGARERVAEVLRGAGLEVAQGGGLSLDVGWPGDPVGLAARVRAGRVAA